MAGTLIQISAAVAGILAAVLIWGQASSEDIALREIADEFSALPALEQERIRLAWNAWKEQDRDTQERLMAIHESLSDAPDLNAKLDRYTQWWTSLDDIERDELRGLPREERLRATQELYLTYERQQLGRELTVHFNFSLFFGRFTGRGGGSRPPQGNDDSSRSIPSLTLSVQQFNELIHKVSNDSRVRLTPPAFAADLTSPAYQLLLNCLLLQRAVLDADSPQERVNLLEDVHELLVQEVPDEDWKQDYLARLERAEGSRRFYEFMTPNLLLRSLMLQLGQRLRGAIAPDDETIIREFASVRDPGERRDLMTRKPEDAIRRIEQKIFVGQQNKDTPETQLIQLFLSIEQRTNDVMRSPSMIERMFQPGSFRGPGPPQNGRGSGTPRRNTNRSNRDREDERP